MNSELLEKIGAEIRLDICSLCEQEKWITEISKTVLQEFPEWKNCVPGSRGLPANHPAWIKYRELWDLHKVICFCLDYDDSRIAICFPHLKKIVTMIEKLKEYKRALTAKTQV